MTDAHPLIGLKIVERLKAISATVGAKLHAALVWTSEAPHKRAVVSVIAWLIVHKTGQVIDGDTLSNMLDIMLAPALAAWSSHTPKIVEPAPPGDA